MRKSVIINRKSIIMTGLVLALAAAIYLNWQYSGGNNIAENTSSRDDATLGQSVYVNKNISSANESDYFTTTATQREKSRNDTIAELDDVINDTKSSNEAKRKAEDNKNTIISNMEKESNIETLVKAKGFEKCIAVVNENSVNVIVRANELTSAQTIQINEIVSEQSGFSSENIKIITVE